MRSWSSLPRQLLGVLRLKAPMKDSRNNDYARCDAARPREGLRVVQINFRCTAAEKEQIETLRLKLKMTATEMILSSLADTAAKNGLAFEDRRSNKST